MAKCPVHREKTGSLSITDMGQGKTRLHCFAGCFQVDVLRAVGLNWKDLRPDGEVGAEIKGRLGDEAKLEKLDRQWGTAWMMCCHHSGGYPEFWKGLASIIVIAEIPEAFKSKPVSLAYWRAVARRIGTERRELRDRMYPEEKRAREFQEKVRRVGWDAIWDEYWRSE